MDAQGCLYAVPSMDGPVSPGEVAQAREPLGLSVPHWHCSKSPLRGQQDDDGSPRLCDYRRYRDRKGHTITFRSNGQKIFN